MRSTSHALKLLDEIFKQDNGRHNIIGYLGGKPASELKIDKLRELTQCHLAKIEEFNNKTDYSSDNVIFVDLDNNTPENLGITFNLQLYYYGHKIRTGESSGSAHSGQCIPVVFEMNGAEREENIAVVKVPYESTDNVLSADYEKAAEQILILIRDDKYLEMLQHNLEQSKKFNNKYIAGKYIELFNKLKEDEF